MSSSGPATPEESSANGSEPLTKVSVAILSWNGRKHLETCLPALKAQKDPGVEWEVLVLDNGSKDGTVDWLEEHHPWVRTVASEANLGFCAGNNRLVDEADGDAVALLNNDTRPTETWLRELVAAYESAPADVAAVSGKIVDWHGRRLDFGRGVMTFDGHAFQLDFRRPLDEARVPDDGEELLFACGGNMLIRRATFLDAGGFDEDFFAYLEDVDLGWRLWALGWRIVFADRAIVHHRSSATSDLLGLYNRGFLFERNAFLTVYKNADEATWRQLAPAVMTTLVHRTQTLLVQNNPGGSSFTLDPYAGLIADTAKPAEPGNTTQCERPSTSASPSSSISESPNSADSEQTVAQSRVDVQTPNGPPAEPPASPSKRLKRAFRLYGPFGAVRRAVGLGLRKLGLRSQPVPQIVDERSVAQLRAITYLLGHLDQAAGKRAQIQSRRKRADREILEKFPLWIVATYPGDGRLFGSEGFRALLGDDVPVRFGELDELMEIEPDDEQSD